MSTVYEIFGWVGMILFLVNYGFVSSGKLDGTSRKYNWIQVIAAVAIAISLIPGTGTLPTIILELCFVMIGLRAILKFR